MNILAQGLESLESLPLDLDKPLLLYEAGNHAIYWLGFTEETVFRCNVYLVKDGEEGILIDPGGQYFFDQIYQRVAQLMPPQKITDMILCHQDPDVAGSMTQWLAVNPAIRIISTPRTHVLLPHYGEKNYVSYDVEQEPRFKLSSGSELVFCLAPFLHFAGAFVTYDTASGYLFSGDIWAALDMDWQLLVSSFDKHIPKMDLFHKDYMASRVATSGFVRTISKFDIQAILPQHGSLISSRHVPLALDYLNNLECGLDLIYAETNIATASFVTKPVPTESETEPVSITPGDPQHIDQSQLRETRLLREALQQSARLASLRDKGLHDLKAAERRLLENEARLSQAQRIAHLGHWDWNIQTNELLWSDEIYRIFGLKPQEFGATYEAFMQAVHLEDRDMVYEAVQHALDNQDPYNIEHRIVLPSGEERIVHEQAKITRDDNGKAIRMLGTVQDITERKRSEQLLKTSYEEIKILKEKEKENIYRATVHSTQHILNNLLNQLYLVKIEIDKNPTFSKKVAQEFDLMKKQATNLVNSLSSVQEIDEHKIKESVYPKKDTFLHNKCLDPEALRQLPDVIKEDLLKASESLDAELMDKTSNQVAQHSNELAQAIRKLAADFRFDLIAQSIESSRHE